MTSLASTSPYTLSNLFSNFLTVTSSPSLSKIRAASPRKDRRAACNTCASACPSLCKPTTSYLHKSYVSFSPEKFINLELDGFRERVILFNKASVRSSLSLFAIVLFRLQAPRWAPKDVTGFAGTTICIVYTCI